MHDTRGGWRSERPRNRQQLIAEEIMVEGTVRIEALAEKHGVSLMTVHRDIDALAARGIVRKTRGAVTALPSSLVEASNEYRRARNTEAKLALAAAAVEWIKPGQSVILDDSTTTERVIPLLADRTPLTVVTNYLSAAEELSRLPDITLICLGGRFFPWANGFLGPMVVRATQDIHADLFIMSTASVVNGVACHQMEETVLTKLAMFAASEMRILLLDHTKFETRALHGMIPLVDFDVVIVDDATPEQTVIELRERGVKVEVAPPVAPIG